MAADPDAVWAVLEDVRAWPTWTATMREVESSTAGPLAVGVTVRVRQPRLPATTWTVDTLVPGRAFSWTSSVAGVTSVAMHAIEPAAQGCRVLLSLTQSGQLAGLSGLLLGRLTRGYLRLEAEGLRDRVERGADR